MDTGTIGKWSYLIGMLLALVGAFAADLAGQDWWVQLLLVLGILAGLFHVGDDVANLGLTYLGLAAVAGSMGGLIAVGEYVSDIANAWVGFLGPVVLTAFLAWGVKKFKM